MKQLRDDYRWKLWFWVNPLLHPLDKRNIYLISKIVVIIIWDVNTLNKYEYNWNVKFHNNKWYMNFYKKIKLIENWIMVCRTSAWSHPIRPLHSHTFQASIVYSENIWKKFFKNFIVILFFRTNRPKHIKYVQNKSFLIEFLK